VEGADERRVNDFVYDDADRITRDVDHGGPACGDEQKLETSYLPNDWVSHERVSKSTASCAPENSWPLRQQTGYAYFRNGLVKTQTTWRGDPNPDNVVENPDNVVESHALDYESDGIYLNGHQTVDSFSLKGPTDMPRRAWLSGEIALS
jgi:hypothetical protein